MYDMDLERERERERDMHRRASRPERGHHYDRPRDYARRHSIPPPLEKMERLRVRDPPPASRSSEYFREDFDMDGRFPPRRSDDVISDVDLAPDEPPRSYNHRPPPPRSPPRGSRRRGPPPRLVVPPEELLPRRPIPDARLPVMDSDSDAEVYPRRRRSESIRSQNDVPPRRRRIRKGDLDDRSSGVYYSGEEATMSSDYRRPPQGGGHRYRGSAPRPRSEYHSDGGEDESSDAMYRGPPRRKMEKPMRPTFIPADRDDLSSPESDDSAEIPIAPAPPMHPGPGPGRGQRLRVPDGFGGLRPPRAPSPEVSFEGPRLKLRKDRDDFHREIPIDPRDPIDIPPPIRDSPDPASPPPGWRMKEAIPVSRSRAQSVDRKLEPETMIREIRPDGTSVLQDEVDILEEVHEVPPLPEELPRDAVADRWAIVNAKPKSRSSPRDSSTSLDIPPHLGPRERERERKPKFSTTGEERPSDDDANFDRARVARRYVGVKDKKEKLWTEITKDLVVKEAIERAGYEYEETKSSYFVFSYLQYEDVSALVEKSEDIRLARRRRIQELDRRRASVPSPRSLHEEPVMRPPSPRRRHRDGRRARERDFIESSRERDRSGRR